MDGLISSGWTSLQEVDGGIDREALLYYLNIFSLADDPCSASTEPGRSNRSYYALAHLPTRIKSYRMTRAREEATCTMA